MKTSKRQTSLRTRLMILSLGITVVLGASSFGILRHINSKSVERELSSFRSFSIALSDAVAAQFFERYGDVQAFSINPSILSSSRKTIVDLLNTYAVMYGIYDLILVTDRNGRLIAVNDRDPSGKPVGTQVLYDANYANTPWHKAVMDGRFTEDKERGFAGTFVEDVQIDPHASAAFGANRLGSSFSAAIKDKNGQVVGVISNRAGSRWFEVAFKEAFETLKGSGYPSSEMYLLLKDKTLAYSHNAKGEMDWNQILMTKLAAISPELDRQTLDKDFSLLDQSTSVENVAGYSPIDGGKFVKSLGWAVVVRDNSAEAFSVIRQSTKIFYIVFAVIMALAVAVSLLFSSAISRHLWQLVERLGKSTAGVTTTADDLATSSHELSEDSIEQAAALQETAASIDEVSAMVKKSAENANNSRQASQGSRDAADDGKKAVQEMISSINSISESNDRIMKQVEDGNAKIGEIVKVISEIGNKTKVINDIVFQTKLLSFNASVEAARAGEHGKGFAVVAEEVGNLAQMSGNAAKEISSMLDESISKVESIVLETKSSVEKLMLESRDNVEVGTRVAQKCDTALVKILAAVEEVDSLVSGIATASTEQAQGVSEINKAINQLDQTTQKSATIATRSATGSASLKSEADLLKNVVNDLTSLVKGTEGGQPLPKVVQSKRPKEHEHTEKKSRSNVVDIAGKRLETARKEQALPLKKVAGGEDSISIPSKDDPRFEDA